MTKIANTETTLLIYICIYAPLLHGSGENIWKETSSGHHPWVLHSHIVCDQFLFQVVS